MKTFIWNTEYAHNNNEQTMQEYLNEYCELDITLIDGTYAEEMDTMVENGLEPKDVNKYISTKVREMFFKAQSEY